MDSKDPDYYRRYFLELTSAILGNRITRSWARNREGALRLAREFGYGLRGADEKTLRDIVTSSYSTILVRAADLRPPIDAKEWCKEIYKMQGE